VNRDDANPLADHLLRSYNEAAIASRAFKERHGQPPTMMEKAHHVLSVMQALVNNDDRYLLGSEYSEFGRVEVTETATGRVLLLRGSAAVSIERSRAQQELFDDTRYLDSPVLMLVRKFHETGLDLSIAGTRHIHGKTHLEATGKPAYLGTWLFAEASTTTSFDQGYVDPFEELGAMDDLGEAGEL
jgi:hypothetical protein